MKVTFDELSYYYENLRAPLKDHPWLSPNILDITEWWSHLCRRSFPYLNAIEHYESSLPKRGIQPINILCWNGRRIRAFYLLWAPPKGLGNNFPKWCMISFEILSMLSKTTPYFDTTNLMNFLFHIPLATMKKFIITIFFFDPFEIFFFGLQSTSSFNDTFSNSPFLKVLFTASSRVIILAYSFAFKPTMFTRIFFFFSFKSPKDTLFHYFNFDLKAYNFFMNLWPSHSFRSTLIPPTIKIFLKIWVRQPQI